jgi:ferrous iron transport protein A
MPSFSINNSRGGDRVWIVSLSSNSDNPYLLSLGLTPGTELQIISRTKSGSVIVAYNDNRIGLGAEIAHTIFVTNMPIEDKLVKTNYITYLRDLPVGTRGRVVGYDRAFLGYMGRLLSMGLLPGTEFTVIRHAFFHYPLQIELKGNLLNLRQQEADALCVEEIEE